MKKKLHIAVVYNEPLTAREQARQFISASGLLETRTGGITTGVDLSEVGVIEAVSAIEAALLSLGYKVTTISATREIDLLIDQLKERQPDLVFNQCESIDNEASHEMAVAGIFELLGILYTGSPPLTLGTALNKVRTKEILSFHGITTPRYQVFRNISSITLNEDLRFPLIVKPTREDASIGIGNDSVVYNLSDLKRRVRYVYQELDEPVLVEEYIDGRELNVSIMGNRKPLVLPISEIDFSEMPDYLHRIVSYEAKWIKESEAYIKTKGVCPAKLSPAVEAKVKQIALRVYQIMGCRDYARVDIRLSKDNVPYVLEVNPNPDISIDAGFVRSATACGMSYEEMVGKIVRCALERGSVMVAG